MATWFRPSKGGHTLGPPRVRPNRTAAGSSNRQLRLTQNSRLKKKSRYLTQLLTAIVDPSSVRDQAASQTLKLHQPVLPVSALPS